MTQQATPARPAHWPSESWLIADLLATFPGIRARPVSEFGSSFYEHGAWVGGEVCMADGAEMFCGLECPDFEVFDGRVHRAFIEWLTLRGWLVEEYDAGVFFISSKAQSDDEQARLAHLRDLLEQRDEAQIVLHRVEAMVATERARVCNLRDAGDRQEAETLRLKAAGHMASLHRLREQRRAYARPSAPDVDAPDLPF